MSRKIGLDCANCRPAARPAHTEYSMEYHETLLAKFAAPLGVAPSSEAAHRALYDAWDFDFLWGTHDGFIDWARAGRCADMGHAAYAADAGDQREPSACPFADPEEVWAFDPVAEYGLCPLDELAAGYEADYQRRAAAFPNQLCTGGYYKSVISGAIQAFGWDMLLMAASDEAKFAKVLERFGAYTLRHARAWAQTSIDVYIQHDDIMWTSGPFLRPDFYREAVFPIYRELWKPLKAAGKKVLYCSDGKVDDFLPDIADCGADGFIFEPCNDFARLSSIFAGGKMLAGSKVDCRAMSFGTWEQVKRQIGETLELQAGKPGLMFAVGNHIPANVSDEMCEKYIRHLQAIWQ